MARMDTTVTLCTRCILLAGLCLTTVLSCETITLNPPVYNSRLIGYNTLNLSDTGIITCGRRCAMLEQCLSFNHNAGSKSCELNAVNGNDVTVTEFEADPDWNFVVVMTKSTMGTGTCEHVTCGRNQECLPTTPIAMCVDHPGCDEPPTDAHATLSPGGTLTNSRRTYTCDSGTYTPDDTDTYERVCQVTGEWSNGDTSCASQETEQWVKSAVLFSSEAGYDSTGYFRASQIEGPNDAYPAYGYNRTSWAQATFDDDQYIEVRFVEAVYITRVDIYENYHAGGVKMISAMSTVFPLWVPIWANIFVDDLEVARIFSPSIMRPPFKSNYVRMDIDCSVAKAAVQIDAIKIFGTTTN